MVQMLFKQILKCEKQQLYGEKGLEYNQKTTSFKLGNRRNKIKKHRMNCKVNQIYLQVFLNLTMMKFSLRKNPNQIIK